MSTTTKREKILAAVMLALEGTPGVMPGEIHRNRVVALRRDKHPALAVEPVSDVPDLSAIYRITWSFTFQILVLARSDAPDADADPIMAEIHRRLMADETVSGLAIDLSPQPVEWKFYEADQTLALITMQFIARYQTEAKQITT
jgi:hypothetical protein